MIISLTSAAEAVLFAAGSEGIKTAALADVLQISTEETAALCVQLQQSYDGRDAGIELICVEGFWQLVTRVEFGPYLSRMANAPQTAQLSQAALEVLAIVAYRQPVSRMEIEAIRGVQSDRVLATLAHRQMIHETGRAEGPGRPILYGTTPLFLQSFGLHSVDDLPPLPQEADFPLDINLFELNSVAPRD